MLRFLVFLLFFFVQPAWAQLLNSSSTDLLALFSLRSTLALRSRDWPRKTDPCSNWTGVTCRSGHVISIDLSGLRRTRLGLLDPRFSVAALKNLGRLEAFNSTGFVLPGPFPARFGFDLPISIRILVLRSSKINGTIPSSLSRLANLHLLDLSHNSIRGSIPKTIGAMPSLKILILGHNRLTGSIPGSLWVLELRVFDVSFNNLSWILPDSVPGELNGNVSAGVFYLSNNLYYGTVSSGFWMFLRRFGSVDLSGNYFQGTIPLEDDHDKSRNRSFGFNCFENAPNQRNPVDCEEFYKPEGTPYYGPISPNLSSGKEKSQLWKYILAGVLGFVGVVIVVVLVIVLWFVRDKARTASDQGGVGIGEVSFQAVPSPPSRVLSKNLTTNGEAFTYKQLVCATSEFSGTNLIKKGHSGDIYRGILDSGFSVVVKRIDSEKVGNKGYVAELELFAKALHTRLVPFLGQCSEKENEKFLVYKSVLYGDLSSALYKKPKQDEEGLASLDWITRLKIAVGVAEALFFLHHECNPPLVHRDVQASSILLDDKFEVRLGSLSEICALEGDGNHSIFKRFMRRPQTSEQGTSGSPTTTCAYDIYCFGKVLLELVTGKLGISGSNDPAQTEWMDHTLCHIGIYDKDSVTKIIDPSLILDEDLTQEAWAVAVIAKSCMDPKPSKRPLARHVLKALENPLKMMRLYSRSNSVRLRTMSSRASWHSAFIGSWRKSSSDSGLGSGPLRRSGTVRSQGSVGELSFTNRRRSVEIFPDPAGKDPADEDKCVGSV